MRAATADLSPALRASQLSYATIEEPVTFLTNHVSQFASIDFFTVPTATFRVLFVFVVLSHARGRIVHMNVTAHPTVEIRRTGGTRTTWTPAAVSVSRNARVKRGSRSWITKVCPSESRRWGL